MCGSGVGQFMEKFDPASARLIKATDPLGSKALGFDEKKTETVNEPPPEPPAEAPAAATSTTTPGATEKSPTSARRQRRGISLLGVRAGTGALAQSSRPQAMGA